MEFYGEKIVSKKILEIIANKVWVLHAYLMHIISTLKISIPIQYVHFQANLEIRGGGVEGGCGRRKPWGRVIEGKGEER